ncbi:MAG: hypothetical protein WDN72_07720 [Alphaproteobacteria bacterium]
MRFLMMTTTASLLLATAAMAQNTAAPAPAAPAAASSASSSVHEMTCKLSQPAGAAKECHYDCNGKNTVIDMGSSSTCSATITKAY